MYSAKNKGTTVPSDLMAKEKLMGYVYEYLIHNGANKTADCFVKEMHFDNRQINQMTSIGDSPGFLFSWWSVFWDLYSSAPERRNLNPHSDEAKAFHDYNFVNGQQNNGQMYINGMQHNSNAPSPLGMPPNDGMPGPGMPPGAPGFFPNSHMRPSPTQPVNQPSPHSQIMQNQQFMTPRYPNVPGPRGPNVRIPQEFNPPTGVPGGQPMMMPGNNMDPNRQGDDFVWQGPPPNMQARMAGPPQQRGVQMNPQMNNMGQFAPSSMRPPVNGQTPPNGQQMPPLNMPPGGGPPNGPGRQWPPNNNMNYNSPSPGNHYCPPVSNAGPGGPPGGPGTPGPGQIMPSPQGSAPYSPANHRMGTPNTGRGDYNLSDLDVYDYHN